jgi:ATP-dependent RNA helicase MSS116
VAILPYQPFLAIQVFSLWPAGCPEPPELEAKTIGKMGLKGVPGLRIAGRGTPDGRHRDKGGQDTEPSSVGSSTP